MTGRRANTNNGPFPLWTAAPRTHERLRGQHDARIAALVPFNKCILPLSVRLWCLYALALFKVAFLSNFFVRQKLMRITKIFFDYVAVNRNVSQLELIFEYWFYM